MDGDLDASRPNWAGNRASLQSSGGDTSSTLDATRPHWHGPYAGSHSQDPAPTATVQQQAQDDQERVVEAVDKAGWSMSRPIDFLKLVGLMEVVDSADDRVRTTLVVDVPLSMFAAVKALGRGLSFEVQLIRVGKKVMENVQLRSEFVVYKKLRGLTDKLDKIEKGDLLRAALLEVRILTHPPLRTHPNIVDIIQLLWEPDPDHLDQAWPVIVLEYAENGTLADFQEHHPNIPFSLKMQLCRDVGNGLLALHASDIVHGDLKSENVLICNTNSGGVVAKLADFGCAIADLEPSDTLKLPAFTMPWNAPECHDLLPRDLLNYTDVYSYGLLVWRVALNGANPFRLIDALSSLEKHQFHREVEALKLQERILPMTRATLHPPLCNTDVDLPLIREVLELTLRLDVVTRDLPSAVARLGGKEQQQQHITKQPLRPYEYESVNVVLPVSGMVPMCLLLSIIRDLVTLSADPHDIGTLACYQLFQIYLARSDWPGARENAARWFWNTVKRQESPLIAVNMRGTFEYLDQRVPKTDLTDVLETYAAYGCPAALVELEQHSPSSFPAIQRCSQLLGGLMSREKKRAISDWVDLVNFEEYCNSLLINNSETLDLSGFIVSENGDLLIHAAARVGCSQVIDKLLSSGIDIDAVNHEGETALLQACRAGSSEMVSCLLDRGANAALAARNGETPLHWVVAFDNDRVETLTELLFSHGAMPCLYSDVNLGSSSAVEYLILYGSPLHYAVLARNETAAQALLSRGADPFFGCEHESPVFLTPFSIAVAKLLPKTVRLMVDPATSRKSLQRYLHSRKESVLMFLVRGSSSPFLLTQWASLGAAFVPSFIETLDIIRPFQREDSISRKPNQKMSLLHACIICGQPAAVIEHLLKTGCSRDLELTSDIRGHTPLQAAIYLNRREVFLLLIKYGANIHRKLVLPEGISYLQYCAMVGIEGQYFANELVSRGVVPKAVNAVVGKRLTPASSPPALTAIYAGNFELATWFTVLEPFPTEIPLLSVLVDSPRMPVSRLRYLLEPPNGLQPVELHDDKDLNRSCFYALMTCKGGPELETIVNLRYLLQQSKARGQEHLINQADVCGFTPLVGAAILGRLELVRELLAAGADPNCGSVTCTNAAIFGLNRLRRAPSQVLDKQLGVILTKKEFRRLEQDFISIITLSRQYGSEEPTILGAPKVDYARILKGGQKGFSSFRKGWEDARLRRQAEDAFRTRFASEGSSASTGLSARDSRSVDRADMRENSLKDKLLGSKGYAKRLLERVSGIDPMRESTPVNDTRAPPVRGPSDQTSVQNPRPPVPPPALPPRMSQQSHLVAPVYQSGHGVPNHIQPLSCPDQTRAQPAQYHLDVLSEEVSSVFLQLSFDPASLHTGFQACFDRYFVHVGPYCLSIESDRNSGAPLGSLSILELEKGFNAMLAGCFNATVLLRDGWIKVVVTAIAENETGSNEVQRFTNEGWMGWRQLEDREAEILAAQLEDTHITQAL